MLDPSGTFNGTWRALLLCFTRNTDGVIPGFKHCPSDEKVIIDAEVLELKLILKSES